ncbi:MAG: FG-GAP-like repeat-containing protein [Vicinamibacterales bacterium]
MNRRFASTALGLAAVVAGLGVAAARPSRPEPARSQSRPSAAREQAYAANNVGVAWLEQYTYDKAVAEFERALQLDASVSIARVNLAIALMYAGRADEAMREATTAAAEPGSRPQPHYVLGLLTKQRNQFDQARVHFERVLQLDPRDVATRVQLGQIHLQQRRYADAVTLLRAALAEEPFNATALYNLGLALTRGGQASEGQQLLERFERLRGESYASTYGQAYLEQGRYAEAIVSNGTEVDLVDPATPDIALTNVTEAVFAGTKRGAAREATTRPPVSPETALEPHPPSFSRPVPKGAWTAAVRRALATSLAGGTTLADMDGDGDLDMLVVSATRERLFRNDVGTFVDVSASVGLSGPPPGSVAIGAVVGDYDNDGRPDVFMLRFGTSTLYHQESTGVLRARTGVPALAAPTSLSVSAAWADVDHDGDLDLFIAGLVELPSTAPAPPGKVFPDDFSPAPHRFLRNNGDGTFTEAAGAVFGTAPRARIVAVVPTDFDNRRDLDLLLVPYGGPPLLMSNMRNGTFEDRASNVGLTVPGRFTGATAADANGDGFTDVILARQDGAPLAALSDGRGRFVMKPTTLPASVSLLALDYDNDGVVDIVAHDGRRLTLSRGTGAAAWTDVTNRALGASGATAGSGVGRLSAGDTSGSGRLDMVMMGVDGSPVVLRRPPTRNRVLRVALAARVSNRSAAGTKLEVRAGSSKQRIETTTAFPALGRSDVVFGLGTRAKADVVRALWPSGIVQAEVVGPGAADVVRLTELDRKPSSCPYLFTWNGAGFTFVSDFLGGGETGYWEAPGVYNTPDADEYVRIRGDQLSARDGRFELRVTNELEETLSLDSASLLSVTHPRGVEVYPDEGMREHPHPHRLFMTRDRQAVARAVDDRGREVTERLAEVDRRFVDDLPLTDVRGYAEPHALTFTLATPPSSGTSSARALLLTGWTDYAFSSDNVAASQRGWRLQPPTLEVERPDGTWSPLAEIGIPVGRPQTLVVPLADAIEPAARLRVVTNMRVYWDAIAVATVLETRDLDSAPGRNIGSDVRVERLPLVSATLRWRGFSRDMSDTRGTPQGFELDYADVSGVSPWKVLPGVYTAPGDVRARVSAIDSAAVVTGPGDEIALAFEAGSLRGPPDGFARTYLLRADGWSQEMDISSANPHRLTIGGFQGAEAIDARGESALGRVVRREMPSLDLAALQLVRQPMRAFGHEAPQTPRP